MSISVTWHTEERGVMHVNANTSSTGEVIPKCDWLSKWRSYWVIPSRKLQKNVYVNTTLIPVIARNVTFCCLTSTRETSSLIIYTDCSNGAGSTCDLSTHSMTLLGTNKCWNMSAWKGSCTTAPKAAQNVCSTGAARNTATEMHADSLHR